MAAHGKKSRNQMGPSDNVVDASHPTVRDDAIEVLSPLVSDGDLGPKSEVTSVTARSSQPGSETALAAALASMNSNNQAMFKQFGDALKALTTRLDEMTEGPGSGSEYSSDEGDAPVDAPNAPSEDTLSQRMRSLLPATPESGVIRDTPPSPRPSPSTASMVPGESVQPPAPHPPASADDGGLDALLSEFAAEYKDEDFGPAVSPEFANVLMDMLRQPLSGEKLKAKANAYNRPENVPLLISPRVNKEIGGNCNTPTATKMLDSQFQNVQTNLMKGLAPLIYVTDSLLASNGKGLSATQAHDAAKELLGALQLLTSVSGTINNMRKDNFRPSIGRAYVDICSHSREVNELLFGDDVSKTAKELNDSNKLVHLVQGKRPFLEGTWRPRKARQHHNNNRPRSSHRSQQGKSKPQFHSFSGKRKHRTQPFPTNTRKPSTHAQ
jgi:hypothetical protein